MRPFALALALIAVPLAAADAECICTCVDGQNVPLCRNAIDLQPLCPARICPIVPLRIQPINPPTIPPLGTSGCSQQQVLNPYTGQYEWRQVCQ